MENEPGAPLADAIRAAQAAARRRDAHGVDHAYAEAAKISRVVAHDHCATLLSLGAIAKAGKRCDEYLFTADDTDLRVLRAQIRSAATDHAGAARDVRELRKRDLTELQQAVLARVAALAAADRYDHPTAESELDAAERHFRRAGHTEHLETIGTDRLLLDVRRNSHVPKTDQTPRTPAEYLRMSTTLKKDVRYEEALALMTRCVTSYEIEPGLRFAVLLELTVLLVMTRQAGAARRLFPLLVAAQGPEVLSTLPDATRTLVPEPRLGHVRRLIAGNELSEAESLLGEGTSALWHLTAAELTHAKGQLDRAAQHFHQAATRTDHAELKALALRKLGDTFADAGDEDQAARCWNESHDDGRVLAAVRRVQRDGAKALAGLVVAVEAARSTTVPGFTDLRAAKRWLRKTIRHLPRDQVVWMMHATPGQLHHVIVGRKITHIATDVHLDELTDAIRKLKDWRPQHGQAVLGSLRIDVTTLIALHDVLEALPRKVTRIAVVARGVLADIPRLGLPHTLSGLPCLSALHSKNGDPVPLETRPEVFLSFAAKDRPHAEQLRTELEARNVNTHLAENDTGPAITDELATSDYYVLLWSANTPQRDWVAKEWTAAFNHELTRRRAFLFIVRLDEEPLPLLLAPRKHIDLVDAADRLVATWRADRKSELPVFPQPVPPAPDGPTVAISVRSHDLGVTHIVTTPLHLTGTELYRAVFAALKLPTEQATFDGTIGMRFSYELFQQNVPIPDDESTVELAADLVDIAVRVESIAPPKPPSNKEYRPDDELDEGLDVDQQRMLLVAAFRHLLP